MVIYLMPNMFDWSFLVVLLATLCFDTNPFESGDSLS